MPASYEKPAGVLLEKELPNYLCKIVGNIAHNRNGDEMKVELQHGSDPDTFACHCLQLSELHREALSDENQILVQSIDRRQMQESKNIHLQTNLT